MTNASHVNSLTANLPSPVTTSTAKLHYPVPSPDTISSKDFLQNQTPNYKLFLLHVTPIHTQHTSNPAYKFFKAHLQKYTRNSIECQLHRMDLFGSDKIHFEIFCQVLLVSLIIIEIPQGYHNHF